MIGLTLLALLAVAWQAGAPPLALGALAPPALWWGPGLGWARRLGGSRLQVGINAAWIGAGLAWVNLSAVRELRLEPHWGLLGLAGAWALAGAWVGRRARVGSAPRREVVGVAAVVVAVLAVAAWRHDDLVRPLDGYWYLTGADRTEGAIDLRPGQGWASVQSFGDGAWKLVPSARSPTLRTPEGAHGRLVLAVRGPLGSRIAVRDAAGKLHENTVAAWMTEDPKEGPVRRYLERGVAGVAADVDLAPGEAIPIELSGPGPQTVYLMLSGDAVWALHAAGELRFVHYYQILNQVENLVWSQEVRHWRWLTLHQPPGWSPLLASEAVFAGDDLPAANLLFLWVLVLVGACAVRLASVVAPGMPWSAWTLPAGMVAAHGLLMFEPASTDFPDSLYAAAVVSVAISIFRQRPVGLAAMGLAAQALRWPGAVVATLLAASARLSTGVRVGRGLVLLWAGALLGLLGTLGLQALGVVHDLGFILWFETFPEHWHGNADPSALLARVPDFYALWTRYTGGGIVVALLLAVFAPGPAQRPARALVGGALAYSTLLATVDHHPTHYFLPLVALTGPAVAAGVAALPWKGWRHLPVGIVWTGLWIFLHSGHV